MNTAPYKTNKPIVIFKHGYTEGGLRKVEEILLNLGHSYTVCQLAEDGTLPNIDGVSGVILMGGPMGVYEEDDHPWIRQEKEWLKDAVQLGLPIFGICFGCQMLAEIFGGRVLIGEKGTSIGFREAKLTVADDPIFGDELHNATVYSYHQDTYVRGEGTQLMQGVMYNEQAAKFKDRVYGVQFHPEATSQLIGIWYEGAMKCSKASATLPNFTEEKKLMEKHLPPVHAWLALFLERLFGNVKED